LSAQTFDKRRHPRIPKVVTAPASKASPEKICFRSAGQARSARTLQKRTQQVDLRYRRQQIPSIK
jgi:hypothetical protein